MAAARAGVPTALVGAVGADELGRSALEELRGEGIDVAGVATVDAPSGVAGITVDARGANRIAVASGANALVDAALVRDRLSAIQAASSGVLLVNHELDDAANAAAVAWARERSLAIVVNPAPARPVPAPVLAAGPIVTPNRDEAVMLTGEPDPAAAAAALAARSGASVVVTLGAEGALLHRSGEADAHVAAPPVAAVDTTGAGDVPSGTLAAEMARGAGIAEAVVTAVTVAAAAVTVTGARGRTQPP